MEWLTNPSLTSPQGYRAGAVEAGIKTYGVKPRLDVGVLVSDVPSRVGGIFTQNKICGAPVQVTRERVSSGWARGLVINSGCSNVAMGERGLADARRMAELASALAGVESEQMLVGSTGVIGRPLPLDRISAALEQIQLESKAGSDFARAMMTTDTVPKSRGVRVSLGGRDYVVAGSAKGSGMSHPNMATVFCFLTTDAAVPDGWLNPAVRRIGDQTINMVDVDMDTSTSDMMLMFANGAAGGPELSEADLAMLEQAALQVSTELAKDLARDGEGARTLLEAVVSGAGSLADARVAARTIVSSPLVKTMVTGRDPNLGRLLMAAGRSGAQLDERKLRVWIGEHLAFDTGAPTELPLATISQAMEGPTVQFRLDLGVGTFEATAWGCDMTEEYVRINASYTT